ncbi:hemoglobin [Dyella jiangningensis]|uniref:group III truncated hemoglobin n=1 Tax=Dyella sp. AtDHG13 TaxID=1938897 RepID=UPI00088F2A4E|nr:group III truncated hemoglobin [Dyella sp. AtDHG13]PXV60336.1 hemoglobin [Dyella sp. AtDHG13]SDJ41270.1 hemoglobin [Dyella jiangningensis]
MALFPTANEIGVATLVDRFYDKVRADAELGPVFNAAIGDWTTHKQTLRDFWSSVILRTGRYQGNPMGAHRALPAFPQALFHRWLELWRETAREVFEPPASELFISTAERIAQSLSMGIGLGRLTLEHPSRVLGPLHIAP